MLSNAAATTMIDAALSLLALAACCDLLLQFARVRGWHIERSRPTRRKIQFVQMSYFNAGTDVHGSSIHGGRFILSPDDSARVRASMCSQQYEMDKMRMVMAKLYT